MSKATAIRRLLCAKTYKRLLSLGQLPQDVAVAIDGHISECVPCCETIAGLSSDDTFVGLLKDARQAATDESAHSDEIHAKTSASVPDVPAALAEHPRYEMLRLIGKGGMGDVYEARHRMMNRTVAIKVIKRELMRKPEAVDRFHREVKTAAQLTHPNIVTSHDAEQADDVHFMVMEYVDGINLSETIREQGQLPVAQACNYIRQAAIGLQQAFEKGMVHRDIKPHNLMVTEDGTVKILDFGLASLAPVALTDADTVEVRSDLTSAGVIMGTPDFISPEQAEDARQADIRSDIYSLGATFYFLLSGRPLFNDGSVMHKLQSHAEVEPDALDSLRDDVPTELVTIVSRMTAKDPDNRFQSPAEVAEALSPFVKAGQAKPAIAQQMARSRRVGRFIAGATILGIVSNRLYVFAHNNLRIAVALHTELKLICAIICGRVLSAVDCPELARIRRQQTGEDESASCSNEYTTARHNAVAVLCCGGESSRRPFRRHL